MANERNETTRKIDVPLVGENGFYNRLRCKLLIPFDRPELPLCPEQAPDSASIVHAITERGFCVDLSKIVTFPISSECWQGTRERLVLNRVGEAILIE
ncbi:hypothetical protein CEXT_759281 [Caerostris extrusa]|uniref:Uncharacterized protein n=1 Tax=Caerostris extrusa TaxID=172846 RepID=A0AAV4UJZ8_CAEEX|nr:hypothetical protein CEXT_759281 [Caerostris extrusa]